MKFNFMLRNWQKSSTGKEISCEGYINIDIGHVNLSAEVSLSTKDRALSNGKGTEDWEHKTLYLLPHELRAFANGLLAAAAFLEGVK